MYRHITLLLLAMSLVACSDSSDNRNKPADPPDFSAADAWLQDFVEQQPLFNGASVAIVETGSGIIHRNTFGDHSEDTVVLLASTSKVPSVMLLMALDEDDDNVDFDIQAPIANYLPWQGVWDEAITTENLVANRSGLPGLGYVFT